MIVVGIDPGLKGGIAVYVQYGVLSEKYILHVSQMPIIGKEIDVRYIHNNILNYDHIDLVAVEKVHSMPKQGVTSTFTFGYGYGKIIGSLEIKNIKFIEVIPQRWKKAILQGYDIKDKKAAINYCLKRFPDVNLIPKGKRTYHDGMADAICLANYALLETARVNG